MSQKQKGKEVDSVSKVEDLVMIITSDFKWMDQSAAQKEAITERFRLESAFFCWEWQVGIYWIGIMGKDIRLDTAEEG